ncbi:hypothetical protein Micbo1qcDRAFT_157982 [Microdochium bolleyi]|uniref:Uncharacterized protein n=1 Tax=Microdochium bolleyi TaxID=196109 RepID=A0A136JFJ7_9PEZI|nr:hypothetical protein Micbo1qcDRAFT_157982 [Microdochium bolleyi]
MHDMDLSSRAPEPLVGPQHPQSRRRFRQSPLTPPVAYSAPFPTPSPATVAMPTLAILLPAAEKRASLTTSRYVPGVRVCFPAAWLCSWLYRLSVLRSSAQPCSLLFILDAHSANEHVGNTSMSHNISHRQPDC